MSKIHFNMLYKQVFQRLYPIEISFCYNLMNPAIVSKPNQKFVLSSLNIYVLKTFPKRKYICPQMPLRFPSNVKEFFLKRFGVFFQTLRHFGVKFSLSGRFFRIFFSRFIRIPVFIQETPPLQAF